MNYNIAILIGSCFIYYYLFTRKLGSIYGKYHSYCAVCFGRFKFACGSISDICSCCFCDLTCCAFDCRSFLSVAKLVKRTGKGIFLAYLKICKWDYILDLGSGACIDFFVCGIACIVRCICLKLSEVVYKLTCICRRSILYWNNRNYKWLVARVAGSICGKFHIDLIRQITVLCNHFFKLCNNFSYRSSIIKKIIFDEFRLRVRYLPYSNICCVT